MGYTFVSGNVALDLAGTVGHRDGEDRYDLLTGPATLASWVVDAGLVDEAPPVDEHGLAATVELREAVFRLARAQLRGEAGAAADRDVLNAAAAAAPVTVTLRPGDGDGVARAGDLDAVRSSIAREAIGLLGGPRSAQLKACGADPCTRLYLDLSRRGARRWCDMRECGNRAKAAAYRSRHAPTG
ncbi:MAG TPA: ABATE domain-containing protein [Pseudonocardia sp.]|jgi:predicted RNA-binding Zn ribbon-like protein